MPRPFFLTVLFACSLHASAANLRLGPLKDMDGPFPFQPPATVEAWKARAAQLRRQMQVALGLFPYPTKTPLHAVVHGTVDRGDYTVEKVFFESMPGFFVTGNLYRPKVSPGQHPGVLCPYGHWKGGRFMEADDAALRKEIATGAEQFEDAARSPLQARCVQLARMGCVVFHFDMIGRGDCLQIPEEIAHFFKTQRPAMNAPEHWGLFSPQAEAHAQNVMGLQTWNSMRALDFLAALPDVDPARLACTGASGGATQTLILAALDPRLAAAFPAVMVSTAMQGGCTCENACGLRVGSSNVEIAALFAPKPMAMTCADDWTREMPVKGFPELQRLWSLLRAPRLVQLTALTQFPHNYNAPSRAAMYAWFNEHLHLDLPPERLTERPFQRLTREEMTVWDAAHPSPAGGPDFERQLLHWWHEDAQKQMSLPPEERQKTTRAAWETLLGRTSATSGDVQIIYTEKQDRGSYWEFTESIRSATYGEEIPAVFLHPKEWHGATVLWLTERGKAGLFEKGDRTDVPIQGVRQLLASGVSVIGVDLLFQGESQANGQPSVAPPKVANPREAAAFTYGYNEPVFAQRVHDILSVAGLVQTDQHHARFFGLVALDGTAPLGYAARVMAPGAFGGAVFPPLTKAHAALFSSVSSLTDWNFLPGGAKYGDVAELAALQSSQPAYAWAGPVGEGEASDAQAGQRLPAALYWLIQKAARK